jgi:hypothetical protein
MGNIRMLISGMMILTLLLSCATIAIVTTKTTAFYIPEYKNSGTIAIIAAEEAVNSSLEFAHYKKQIEQKLAANGYSIVNNPSEAQFIGLVAYGIDNGKSAIVSTPIFGQTGGGTTNSSVTVNGSTGSATYSGTSYTMPTYGVVGSETSSETIYTRAIALDIVDAESLKKGTPKKVYEARAKSTGRCGIIAGVIEEMLEAMFKDFPGINGKVRSVEVPFKGGC